MRYKNSMTKEEDQYKEELKTQGVEVEEEKKTEEPVEETPAEKPKVEDKVEEPEKKLEEEPKKEEEKEVFKKRSIYDEYKDKKSELKSEKDLREKFETENTELKDKLEALKNADTPKEKQDALDDIDELAKEINADPEAIRKLQKVLMKGVKPTTDENLQKDLDEFKSWKTTNQKVMETQQFDTEFETVLPQIKSDFPKISEDEVKSIKEGLDKISHSKEYHDKSLDYVVFKNKEELTALISPHKKGMETKERKDIEVDNFVFDPNVDITKLSQTDFVKWEKAYKKATESSEELVMDGKSGKMIV